MWFLGLILCGFLGFWVCVDFGTGFCVWILRILGRDRVDFGFVFFFENEEYDDVDD